MEQKQVQLTVRMNAELYDQAMAKCNDQLSIPLSTLVKVFLKAFVSQRGVGFYIGDEDLTWIFNRWIQKKRMERQRKGQFPLPGPHLRDLFDL